MTERFHDSNINIYTIYDKLAEEAGNLFYARNDFVAKRSYDQVLGDNAFKADFVLYRLGQINLRSMQIEKLLNPEEVK